MPIMKFVSNTTDLAGGQCRLDFRYRRRIYEHMWDGDYHERICLTDIARAWGCPNGPTTVEVRQWGRGVLENVARPYHRTDLAGTITNVLIYLRNLTGRSWTCDNLTALGISPADQQAIATLAGWTGIAVSANTFQLPTPRHRRDLDSVQGYDFKPTPIFQFTTEDHHGPSTLYCGVELEVDCHPRGPYPRQDRIPALVRGVMGDVVYCKTDSTLRYGCEIVTHPGTEKWWLEQQDTVRKMLAALRTEGWRSHDTRRAGMHVHMSRGAFDGAMHLYRLLHLIYRYPTLSALVSQRTSTQLDAYANLANSKRRTLKAKAGMVGDYGVHHHDAVNITRKTIEVRLFNGTLRTDRFYKNLEYCFAAHAFTQEVTLLRHVRIATFMQWLVDYRKRFPNLVAFLEEAGQIVTPSSLVPA